MIVVTHFQETEDDFSEQLGEVLRVLSPRPGFMRGSGGRSTDDDSHWVLVTEWDTVGSYRRALGNYDVKLHATTILARADDRPSGFEQLVGVDGDGRAWRQRSDRGHADGPGRSSAISIQLEERPR